MAMEYNPIAALIERAEELGWDCTADAEIDIIEFRQSSPAGEDFLFEARGNTAEQIIGDIREYAEDFDEEEHVKMWLDAKEHGTRGVPDLFTLVEDSKDIKEMLETLACSIHLYGKSAAGTLRQEIEETKEEYEGQYGALDWRFTDEGLPWTIQDYHGRVGSVMDFTEDDWRVCKENGWTLDDICTLCCEPWFGKDVDTLSGFLHMFLEDTRQRTGEYFARDEELDKEDALAAVKDFYTWRKELFPIIRRVFD